MNNLFRNLFFSDFDTIFNKVPSSIPGFLLVNNTYEFKTKLFAGTDVKDITAEVKDKYLHIYNKTEKESSYAYIIVSIPSDLDVKSISTTYKNGVLKLIANPDKTKTFTLSIEE